MLSNSRTNTPHPKLLLRRSSTHGAQFAGALPQGRAWAPSAPCAGTRHRLSTLLSSKLSPACGPLQVVSARLTPSERDLVVVASVPPQQVG
jgi:hypothetical protein